MKIFPQEIQDGIEDKIISSASITYASSLEPCSKRPDIKEIKSLASFNDDDLYYVQSILVTSTWNKNDDIFDKSEVWLARNTPEDKPTNLEHDESMIIGHITSTWPITTDGILIDENTPIENLPEKYHILTGSVIYKAFTGPELKDRSEQLIAQIIDGSKYVSMECFFKGFDYGLIDKGTGAYKVLARNEQTAYLTKYLRAYGGLGEHDNYKIGRVLRNITFSGKGFVDKPANPESIIFTKHSFIDIESEKKDDLLKPGVSISQSNLNVENITMNSDLEPIMTEVADIKAKLEALQGLSEAVSSATALKNKTIELEGSIKANEEKIAQLTSALELANSEKEEAAKKMKKDEEAKDEEAKNLKAALEAANEIIAGYKDKEEEMAKKEKKMKRVATLMEMGINNDAATATVEQFAGLDDETFAAMTSLFAGKMPPWLKKDNDEKETDEKKKKEEAAKKTSMVEDEEEMAAKKKKASENTVDASVLETAEVEETVELSVGGHADVGVSSTRAALVDFVCSRLGTKLNKGE